MILEEHGKEVADKANYGWGVIDETAYIDVCTKVYGTGSYLRSVGDRFTGLIKHNWE